MNERGRTALISAQMRGVRQIKYRLMDGDGGFCAGGVLLEAIGYLKHAEEVGICQACAKMLEAFGMDKHEWTSMVNMNNVLGYDFIKIARELPDTEAVTDQRLLEERRAQRRSV